MKNFRHPAKTPSKDKGKGDKDKDKGAKKDKGDSKDKKDDKGTPKYGRGEGGLKRVFVCLFFSPSSPS